MQEDWFTKYEKAAAREEIRAKKFKEAMDRKRAKKEAEWNALTEEQQAAILKEKQDRKKAMEKAWRLKQSGKRLLK